MEKYELMNFDLVTLRNGDNYFKWRDILIATEATSAAGRILQTFNDDLTNTFDKDLDIMRVRRFCPPNNTGVLVAIGLHYFMNQMLTPGPNLEKYMKVIWERVETKEVTMDEIAKKFGVSVRNLRIKK